MNDGHANRSEINSVAFETLMSATLISLTRMSAADVVVLMGTKRQYE